MGGTECGFLIKTVCKKNEIVGLILNSVHFRLWGCFKLMRCADVIIITSGHGKASFSGLLTSKLHRRTCKVTLQSNEISELINSTYSAIYSVCGIEKDDFFLYNLLQ